MVFCTNAAQESLTLDTHVVIDTTVHKHMELDPVTGRQYLKQEPAPMSHLLQRKGRVGRIPLTEEQKSQGYEYKYYALCTENEWKNRPAQESAEMQRTDLIHDTLLMYADGYDPYRFDYINKPEDSHIKMAVDRLAKLGAIEGVNLRKKECLWHHYHSNRIFPAWCMRPSNIVAHVKRVHLRPSLRNTPWLLPKGMID